MYDFLENRESYVMCCMLHINKMPKEFLYDLLKLKYATMDKFVSKYNLKSSQLKKYDVSHIARCKQLIQNLLKGQTIAYTVENMEMFALLMSKRYILTPKTSSLHVSCDIYVMYNGKMKQLKINRYNTKRGKNSKEYKLTYMSGYAELDETAEEALLREASEELGFNFPIQRYYLVSVNDQSYTYEIYLTQDEYETYCDNLDTSILDPEITRIVLC